MKHISYNLIKKYIDCFLVETTCTENNKNTYTIEDIMNKANLKKIIDKIYESKIIYIHPDGFDQWTDILILLAQKKHVPTKLFIIAGSDISIYDENIEAFVNFYPQSQFWITNWMGSLDRCKLLPLGDDIEYDNKEKEKKEKIFTITHSSRYNYNFNYDEYYRIRDTCKEEYANMYVFNTYREDYFVVLDKIESEELQQYKLPYLGKKEYYKELEKTYFTPCPMGNGMDTYRFWEALYNKCIPIVIKHTWYDAILSHYPNVKMIQMDDWSDLVKLVPELTIDRYNKLMLGLDLSDLDWKVWEKKLDDIVKV